MAPFVIPRVTLTISQQIVVRMPSLSGAVDNIVEQDILQFQSDKVKGVEVMHVLAMSGMGFWTWDKQIELEMYKNLKMF